MASSTDLSVMVAAAAAARRSVGDSLLNSIAIDF
jgi:hypothetical protein